MTWFRVDDSFPAHRKVLRIPRRDRPAAIGLWTLAGTWCASQLTDGLLDECMVAELAGTKRAADLLVSVGLWEKTDGGYLFHDYLDYNPSAEEVRADQAAKHEAKAKAGRLGGIASGVARRKHEGSRDEAETKQDGSNREADAEQTASKTKPRPDPTPTRGTERGDVTYADVPARELPDDQPPAVPDTPPPPIDEPRTEAPPAPVHSDAMPPDRCRLHRELHTVPPCGRCKEAKAAQKAWIADRDAKVAQARADAQAEIRRERDAVRVAIDRCGRCNERGVHSSTGILCSHDDAADEAPATGRAEFRAAKAALAARVEQREAGPSQPGAPPPATGEQLTAIATALGARGITSRPGRLLALTDIVGRPVGSSKDLTANEAHVVLDRLTAPPLDEPPDEDEPPVEVEEPPAGEEPESIDAVLTGADEYEDTPAYVYAGGTDEPPF